MNMSKCISHYDVQENYTVSQNWQPPASEKPNSVCSSWISTKYCTLHYLNIT